MISFVYRNLFGAAAEEKRRLKLLGKKIEKYRDQDFQELKAHCFKVQNAKAKVIEDLVAEKKSNEALSKALEEERAKTESLQTRVNQLNERVSDLEISLDNAEHKVNKLKQDLELSTRLNQQLAQVIERDRQRVIAEKNAYIALGEKAGSQ